MIAWRRPWSCRWWRRDEALGLRGTRAGGEVAVLDPAERSPALRATNDGEVDAGILGELEGSPGSRSDEVIGVEGGLPGTGRSR